MRPFHARTHRIWRIGDWTLDEGCHRLMRGDEVRSLNPKEMGVLRHLAEAAPDLVDPEALFARTWPDVVVGDHVLHEVISRLRKALGDKAHQPTYIETLPRRGYRLLVAVELTDRRSQDDSAPFTQGGEPSPSRLEQRRRGPAIASLALVMSVIAASALQHGHSDGLQSATAGRQQIGIAVLPFVNLSGDPAKDYLGDAIASEVVNQLRPSDTLRVISMTSSRAFRNSRLDIREIGARMTADYILEGELTQSDTRLRANLRLIETSRGINIWGNRQTISLSDLAQVFALYDQVAFEAARAIESHLGKPASTSEWRLRSAPPDVDAAAYHLLLRAAFRFEESGDPRAAIALVDQALERAPDWPKALNAKAAFLTKQAEYGMVRGKQGFEAARAWARKAVETDPALGDAHATLGFLDAAIDLDFRAAMARFEKAERLGASIEILWPFKEYVLLNAGRYEEALAINRRFEAISPASAVAKASVGRLLWRLGRNAEAATKLEEALKLAPTNLWVCTEVLRFYVYRTHDADRSAEVIDQCFAGSDGTSRRLETYWRANLAHFLEDSMPLAILAEKAEQRSRTSHVDSRSMALMHYRLGRYDKHIHWTRMRIQARQQLIELPDELRTRPHYWPNLREWALSDPDETAARLELIDEHRARIDAVTRHAAI